ncbi:MAG: TOTE conflict system archaeo-eukaryotic primase domain-containing protein [Acidimicrobiales bacterium]
MTDSADPRVQALEAEVQGLRAENDRLRSLLGLDQPSRQQTAEPWEPTLFVESEREALKASVDKNSPAELKIALFRSLFSGRDDVYALRWESARTGKKGWSPAVVGGWANAKKPRRQYLPFSEDVVEFHLAGGSHVGLYPLRQGDECRLLACDFDGTGWVLDSLAYLDAAAAIGVPVALERSRSGDGAHTWTFFSGPVPAASARRLGVHILREAMEVRAELDLSSYDRLFPTQDFVPKGSFGNLIALPLQGECRRQETTVFLDPANLEPYEDQWAFLASVPRMSPEAVVQLEKALLPVAAGPDDTQYRRPGKSGPTQKPPDVIPAVSGAMLEIDRIGVPPALLAALKHLASLHNPDYYEKERLRFSTWNTPRFLRCYAETIDRLHLPRGIRDQAVRMVVDAGSTLDVVDACNTPGQIDVSLQADLTDRQERALDALVPHDLGVLVAPPGSGKTVIACALIAHRQVPTLVVVDRQPLVEQWRERLGDHLGMASKDIGQLGGGRNRAKGIIDIAMAQSLARRDDLREITAGYGLVVVDECHHVPAVTFERVVRQIPVRHWLGLTATPYRRDHLEKLITMYCGPERHRMNTDEPEDLKIERVVIAHVTSHDQAGGEGIGIYEVFRAIVEDDERSAQICDDISRSAEIGRNCLVLAQWTEHVEKLSAELRSRGMDTVIMRGGMGKKARAAATSEMQTKASNGGLVLVATGSFLGEGFDFPELDTLFLAFPLAFKGRIVQYVGRILRPTASKSRVEVHDYVDINVPVLSRMHSKRLAAYNSLGFLIESANAVQNGRRLT